MGDVLLEDDWNLVVRGNCLDELQLVKTSSVNLVLPDPPYNLSKTTGNKKSGLIRKVRPNSALADHKGSWDEMSEESFKELICGFLDESFRVLADNGTIIVFCSHHEEDNVKKWISERFEIMNRVLWHKSNPSPLVVKNRLVWSYESMFVARKGKGNTVNWGLYPYTEMHDVWNSPICQGKERLKDENGKSLHPTQKPLSIIEKAVRIFSNEGDVILDPFAGVCTTLVAAKKNGRKSIGFDLSEKYLLAGIDRLKDINA
jgi:DNA modification methylase